ncbi:MAG: hypothetical protein JNJ88_21155 [Planctomycetes bacterium]|nr:hypothetical protein [Planctomycetota bacterium]
MSDPIENELKRQMRADGGDAPEGAKRLEGRVWGEMEERRSRRRGLKRGALIAGAFLLVGGITFATVSPSARAASKDVLHDVHEFLYELSGWIFGDAHPRAVPRGHEHELRPQSAPEEVK